MFQSVQSTPVSVLAARKDAPMDLFDLLITPENINGNPERCTPLRIPLHVALEHGHTNIALHLIEQGANVGVISKNGKPAITHCC